MTITGLTLFPLRVIGVISVLGVTQFASRICVCGLSQSDLQQPLRGWRIHTIYCMLHLYLHYFTWRMLLKKSRREPLPILKVVIRNGNLNGLTTMTLTTTRMKVNLKTNKVTPSLLCPPSSSIHVLSFFMIVSSFLLPCCFLLSSALPSYTILLLESLIQKTRTQL